VAELLVADFGKTNWRVVSTKRWGKVQHQKSGKEGSTIEICVLIFTLFFAFFYIYIMFVYIFIYI